MQKILFSLVLCFVSASSSAVETLPRKFGPFSLGMRLSAFEKIVPSKEIIWISSDYTKTGGTALSSSTLRKYFPLVKENEGADFMFSSLGADGQLYSIDYWPETTDVNELKGIYERRYGKANVIKNAYGGPPSHWLEWCEPDKTRMLIRCFAKTNKAYSVTIQDMRVLKAIVARDGSGDIVMCGKMPVW